MKSSIHACIMVEGHPICGYTEVARHVTVCQFLRHRNWNLQYEVRYEIVPGQETTVSAEVFLTMYDASTQKGSAA